MELSEKVENVGGGGGYAYSGFGGSWGLFLMAIFLVVLFSLFRHNSDHHGNDLNTGMNMAHAMGEWHPREGCADKLTWSRYANYVDPEIMRNHIEQTRDTGNIMREQAVNAGAIRADIDRQTGALLLNQEKTTASVLANQNAIARDQERMFFNSQIDSKNEKLAEQRERAIMLESKLMASEAAREADRRQSELMATINAQFCNTDARIANVECNMLRQPPFYAFGGVSAINACPPCGGYGGTYDRGGCQGCGGTYRA